MRVYIGCFGSGLGHASRMLEVARLLRDEGSEVEMSSSGEVASLIERKGFRCNRLPLADVQYSDSGEFQIKETMLSSPSILARTYRQVGDEVSNIVGFGPDVVLSDSALSTVIAARAMRLPVFTVLNQLNLTSSHGEEGPLSRLLSVGISAGMGKLWELSDEVLLPDLPPPYTISERNLWGSNVTKTRYVGFLAAKGNVQPDAAAREFRDSPKPKVFWQVSGPPQTRSELLKKALQYSSELSDRFSFVITGGDPKGSTVAVRVPGGWYYGWCEIADFYFGSCDIVVARAGHGTLGQAITEGKPSLLVPIPKQPEQEGNAEKAERLGVSVRVPQASLNLEGLKGAFGTLLSPEFRERTAALGAYSKRFNAGREIMATVSSAARRGRRSLR